jgi:ribosomal 50S subunit-recycling heat shock protein
VSGKAVTDAAAVKVEDELDIHLLRGSLKAKVTEVCSEVRGDFFTD